MRHGSMGMLKTECVWYFCRPPDGKGLVLAAELPPDYYSLGSFYLPGKVGGGLAERYTFRTVWNCSEHEFDLVHSRGQLFVVQVPDLDVFTFRAKRIRDRYVGKVIPHQSNVHCFVLDPIDECKLEDACQEHGFFFAGQGIYKEVLR